MREERQSRDEKKERRSEKARERGNERKGERKEEEVAVGRSKEEGARRKEQEGRSKKEETRWKEQEGRSKKEETRWKEQEGKKEEDREEQIQRKEGNYDYSTSLRAIRGIAEALPLDTVHAQRYRQVPDLQRQGWGREKENVGEVLSERESR